MLAPRGKLRRRRKIDPDHDVLRSRSYLEPSNKQQLGAVTKWFEPLRVSSAA